MMIIIIIIIIIMIIIILYFNMDFVCTCMQTEIYIMPRCRIQLFKYILFILIGQSWILM